MVECTSLRRFRLASVLLYLGMGWTIVVAIKPLMALQQFTRDADFHYPSTSFCLTLTPTFESVKKNIFGVPPFFRGPGGALDISVKPAHTAARRFSLISAALCGISKKKEWGQEVRTE
jgi:hypothetical protein